jgi:transposase
MKRKIKSIGIDVSKDKLDICLLLENEKTKYLQISNNQSDVPRLIKIFKSYQSVEETPIVIEATGGYHYAITFFLQEKGLKKVFVINPLITKKFSKSSIRKTKTDKIDSKILAKIGLIEELRSYAETKLVIMIKKKVRLLHFLNKQLQQISGRLKTIKGINFQDNFEEKILLKAKADLKNNIKEVKKKIISSMEIKSLKIIGVSELTIKIILAELGNVNRFKNHKQVIAFTGIDPTVKESGTSIKGKSVLSKRGSNTMRYFLYQAAWGVMMHNKKYQKYYQKKKKEGKHYYTCLSAIARKLLQEIYAEAKKTSYCIKA